MPGMTSSTRLVVAFCSALALAACGSSSDGGSKASSSPSPTPTVLSAAEAKTVAAAGVLSAADMPGYTAKAAEEDDPDAKAADAVFRTCIGLPTEDYLGSDLGREFNKGDLDVNSSVDVARTAEIAKAELDAYNGTRSEECAKAEFTKLFQAHGATVTSFKLTPVAVTVPGSDEAFGQEISMDLSNGGQTAQLRGLDLGALVGQVEVKITVLGTPTESLPLADAQALLVKATGRVKAAA
jgi:hypothetical protein